MKKILLSASVLVGIVATAQVNPNPQKRDTDYSTRIGVNTETPQASMEIKELLNGANPIDTRIQGLSLPNFTTEQRSKFGEGQTESMKIGTIIYNTTKKCIEMYLGYYNGAHQWSCNLTGQNNSSVVEASVMPSGFDGVYVAGVNLDYNYRYVKFKIKNNSFSPISNVDFSNAVTLTNTGGNVSIVSGQNTNITINGGQERELTYRITGTANEGILKADFNGAGGLTATQQINVPKASATISDVVIETWSFDTTQGTISSRNISIPFTRGLGKYEAVDIDVTPLEGEGGDQNGMKLTIPAGTFHDYYENNGTIYAKLTVDGDNLYNIKKNVGGLKQDYATFNVTLGATSFKVILRSLGGYEAFIEQEASRNYTRNNCDSGFNGETVTYKRTARERGISWSNQTEADNNSIYYSKREAERLVNIYSEGQAYANQYGRCISTGRATIADYTHTPILSFDTTLGELRDGLTINIPYTNGVYGGYEAVNTTAIATAPGEGGDVNNISLSIAKGIYNSGNSTIPATIKVDGDLNYLVKKTEGDNNGYTIATIPVTMSTGETFNVILKAKGGWRETGSYTGTGTYRKNDCGIGYEGNEVSYTGTATAEGVSSISKADAMDKANTNAKAKFDEQGQLYANTNGTCRKLTYKLGTCTIPNNAVSGNWSVYVVSQSGQQTLLDSGVGIPTNQQVENLFNQMNVTEPKELLVNYLGRHTGSTIGGWDGWVKGAVSFYVGLYSNENRCISDVNTYVAKYPGTYAECTSRPATSWEYTSNDTLRCPIMIQ